MTGQYKGVFDLARDYWRSYGGLRGLLGSPYAHCAVVMSVIAYGLSAEREWAGFALSILPNVLGFSVGGYAILMSFGGERFLSLLARVESTGVAALKGVSASFVHFVLVQSITLGWALVASSTKAGPLSSLLQWLSKFPAARSVVGTAFHWTGGFLLWYSLFCGVAATMGIFRLARMFVTFERLSTKDKDTPDNS